MTQQHDLVARLRECANGVRSFKTALGDYGICDEAAARIEALESRQRALREALTTIGHSLVCAPTDYAEHNARALLEAGNIARAALAGDA